jgi:hypothetical protein
MPHDPRAPLVPDDDPVVERMLSGAGRFSPQRGFEERVVSRVRVPLPLWLRGVRDRWRGLTSGVSGWTILATFSLASAAAWGVGAAVGLQAWGEVAGVTDVVSREVGRGLRIALAEGVVPAWRLASAEVSAWLQSFGFDPRAVVIGYGVVVLASAVAVRRLTAEPANSRGTENAAS